MKAPRQTDALLALLNLIGVVASVCCFQSPPYLLFGVKRHKITRVDGDPRRIQRVLWLLRSAPDPRINSGERPERTRADEEDKDAPVQNATAVLGATNLDQAPPWSSNPLEDVDDLIEELLSLTAEEANISSWPDIQIRIRKRTEERHAADCDKARAQPLAIEQLIGSADSGASSESKSRGNYEWIDVKDPKKPQQPHRLALRSQHQPLLNHSSIDLIRRHAERHWRNHQGDSSRFTYQRQGNYEAHVADLGPAVTALVNETLQQQVYPTIRQEFATLLSQQQSSDPLRLFVYDALYIRYNATEAAGTGAGQPLHRDLSLVSVNIMLNDDGDFQGGGTFFENQLQAAAAPPLKPRSVGHCLMHSSAERHAGANTQAGVRDVMILFVSAESTRSRAPPLYIQNALLKQCFGEQHVIFPDEDAEQQQQQHDAQAMPFLCSLCHNRLAVKAVPHDGEAYQYLANALVSCADWMFRRQQHPQQQVLRILQMASEAYSRAAQYTPCDGRIYNNWGLARTKLRDRRRQQSSGAPASARPNEEDEENLQIAAIYEKGMNVLEQSFRVGCDVDKDRNAIRLNYGLFVANQDLFQQATNILSPIVQQQQHVGDDNVVLANAQKLFGFCARQAALSNLN